MGCSRAHLFAEQILFVLQASPWLFYEPDVARLHESPQHRMHLAQNAWSPQQLQPRQSSICATAAHFFSSDCHHALELTLTCRSHKLIQVHTSVLLVPALNSGLNVLSGICKKTSSKSFAHTDQVIHCREPRQTQTPEGTKISSATTAV